MKITPGGAIWSKVAGVSFLYGLVAVGVLFLTFFHLDGRLYWEDEAETGVLAKNILRFGLPRVNDGLNDISFHGDKIDASADGLWTWSPWLQEYVAAGSFAIFGPTTWAGRAPFALIGWFDVILAGLVAWKIYQRHRVAIASMILLGTSEIFLLHIRQCRYYSIAAGAEILLVYGAHQLLRQDRRGVGCAALALILQFYSNYIIAAANIPALFFLAWQVRKGGWRAITRVAAIMAILAVVALPWLVYAHPWGQTNEIGGENYFKKIRIYITDFHFYFLPLCVLVLPLGGLIFRRGRPLKEMPDFLPDWERLLLVLLPLYLAMIITAPGIYLRYLLPILPVACILGTAWLFRHVKWPALAWLLILVQPLSNVFSLATAWPIRQTGLRFPLACYVEGLVTPYADRFSDVLAFFQKNARPGDTVMSPDGEFPLIFYTRLKIINAVLLTEPPPNLPDWILTESASSLRRRKPSTLSDSSKANYDPVIVDVHASVRWGSYPEPYFYEYQSTSNHAEFLIYKLKPSLEKN